MDSRQRTLAISMARSSDGTRQSGGGHRAGSRRPDGGDRARVDDRDGSAGLGIGQNHESLVGRSTRRRMAHAHPGRPASRTMGIERSYVSRRATSSRSMNRLDIFSGYSRESGEQMMTAHPDVGPPSGSWQVQCGLVGE